MIDLEPGEEVRGIEGFPNYYVTSFGRVIAGPSVKGRHPNTYLQLSPGGKRYLNATLIKESKRYTKLIHMLVAEAFIPNSEGKPTVNHKNGEDRYNNNKDNLEWADHSEQQEHALQTGLKRPKSWGIHELAGQHNKPFQVKCRIKGVSKYFGVYFTFEEASSVLDKICEEYGIVRPFR